MGFVLESGPPPIRKSPSFAFQLPHHPVMEAAHPDPLIDHHSRSEKDRKNSMQIQPWRPLKDLLFNKNCYARPNFDHARPNPAESCLPID